MRARENALLNGVANVEFVVGDAARAPKELLERGVPAPDVVVVDPPRAGLTPRAVKRVVELAPERLVYVSCNPTTLAGNGQLLGRGRLQAGARQAVRSLPAHAARRVRRPLHAMSRAVEESNRRMLRARDAMDRDYARRSTSRRWRGIAHVSEAHFIRTFRATFGETPHRYLQRRRVERAMFLLRETRAQRDATSASTSASRASARSAARSARSWASRPRRTAARADVVAVPSCFAMAWTRPSSFGEAPAPGSR